VGPKLRAQTPIELPVRSLDQKIIVESAQRRDKSICVLVRFDAVGARDLETLGRAFRSRRDQSLEEITLAASELGERRPLARDRAHAERIGEEGADHPSVTREVAPEDRDGILLSRLRDRVDVSLFCPPMLEHVAPLFRRSAGTERSRSLTGIHAYAAE